MIKQHNSCSVWAVCVWDIMNSVDALYGKNKQYILQYYKLTAIWDIAKRILYTVKSYLMDKMTNKL